MKACLYSAFGGRVSYSSVADPKVSPEGVILRVEATGLCRSDWHGWQGHDPDIRLPHVPGHELAGIVEVTGRAVRKFRKGDRVTLPFVCGCGRCEQCQSGNPQVCDNQFQPGFTHWGSFAQYVAIEYADFNLVHLPEEINFSVAASLGCRFGTAWRALVVQGNVKPNQWLAIHGCGGVGLSAIMIACHFSVNVIAVDISSSALALAKQLGADYCLDASSSQDIPGQIRDLTSGGAQVSLDAFGSKETCLNSIQCLRKQGRHVQVGLMTGQDKFISLAMDSIIANELAILGSHGIQSVVYHDIFKHIISGELKPDKMITRETSLSQAGKYLENMNSTGGPGITMITTFD